MVCGEATPGLGAELNILNRVHKMVLRFHFLKYMRQKRNASLASLALRLGDDFDGT